MYFFIIISFKKKWKWNRKISYPPFLCDDTTKIIFIVWYLSSTEEISKIHFFLSKFQKLVYEFLQTFNSYHWWFSIFTLPHHCIFQVNIYRTDVTAQILIVSPVLSVYLPVLVTQMETIHSLTNCGSLIISHVTKTGHWMLHIVTMVTSIQGQENVRMMFLKVKN